MSQQSGGSWWGRYGMLAVILALLLFIPAVRTLIMTILGGLK